MSPFVLRVDQVVATKRPTPPVPPTSSTASSTPGPGSKLTCKPSASTATKVESKAWNALAAVM